MKRIIRFCSLAAFFAILASYPVFADATIEKGNVSKGIVTIKYSGDSKDVKAMVEKGSEKYVYTVKSGSINVPLQMGTGDYKISVLEGLGGGKYKPLVSESIKADKIDEKAMYTTSIPNVNFNNDMKSVAAYKQMTNGKKTDNDKANTIYTDVVKNYNYDFDKAKNVKNDYIPVIDDMYAAKKGICYDYSSLMAGTLRSQSVPTKLVMGYAPGVSEYHAWNEILIDGKWVIVDSTTDSQYDAAGAKYSFSKDSSKYKVVKTY